MFETGSLCIPPVWIGIQVFSQNRFEECYHLAAQSFVVGSFNDGFRQWPRNVNGTRYVLEAIRSLQPSCQLYFAGSSEMFGKVRQALQTEDTSFYPCSPYGISKVAAEI
jgi:GDPmannose 4,6-dehydratase